MIEQYAVDYLGGFNPESDRIGRLSLLKYVAKLGMVEIANRTIEEVVPGKDDVMRRYDMFCEATLG